MSETIFTIVCFIMTSFLIVGLAASILNGYYILSAILSIPFILAILFVCYYLINSIFDHE